MTATLCNNSGTANATCTGGNGVGSAAEAILSTTLQPSSSGDSASISEGVKWNTVVIPAGVAAESTTLPRPKRDFRFQRIEVEETPKWFVWPQRKKKGKLENGNEKIESNESSSSSENNNSSQRGDGSSQGVSKTTSETGTALETNNNSQQQQKNICGVSKLNDVISSSVKSATIAVSQKPLCLEKQQFSASIPATTSTGKYAANNVLTSSSNAKGARHIHRQQHHIHYHTAITTSDAATIFEPINTFNTETSNRAHTTLRRHAASSLDGRHHFSGSATTDSKTFKILSILKKTCTNGDEDEVDLKKCMVLNCEQPLPHDS